MWERKTLEIVRFQRFWTLKVWPKLRTEDWDFLLIIVDLELGVQYQDYVYIYIPSSFFYINLFTSKSEWSSFLLAWRKDSRSLIWGMSVHSVRFVMCEMENCYGLFSFWFVLFWSFLFLLKDSSLSALICFILFQSTV